MFNWGQSLYHALRAASIGGLAFLLLFLVSSLAGVHLNGGRASDFLAVCLLIGFVRLGWDGLTKKFPDA
jgi:hypothetical protein